MTSERLGGKPRDNAQDAYDTIMEMTEQQYLALLSSMISGGVLTEAEQEGFLRAVDDRREKQRL